jgi:hypothetical protein
MLVDECQRNWALRYLKEARAELNTAKSIPKISSTSIYEALRKARMAVFHVLGEPNIIEIILQQTVVKNGEAPNALLRFLLSLNESLSQMEEVVELPAPQREMIFKKIESMLKSAEDVVNLFIDESKS